MAISSRLKLGPHSIGRHPGGVPSEDARKSAMKCLAMLIRRFFFMMLMGAIIAGCSQRASTAVLPVGQTSGFAAASHASVNPDRKLQIIAVYHLAKGTGPSGITMGSDGNMWFTLIGKLEIGRITPTGQVTYFPASKRDAGNRITSGPDKNLWFTVFGFPEIDRMTTTGTFTPFVVQGNPQDIVGGPDGNLWYTDFTLQSIGRMTLHGRFKEFTVPTQSSYPYDITVGPDNNLWFTEINSGKVGKCTTTGVITEYALPESNPIPVGIASANGNLYAVENSYSKIAQITTSGVISTYQAPQTLNFIDIISDGRTHLIASARYQGKIGGFDPVAHTFSSFISIPKHTGETNAGPDGIALGPGGNIWFTSANNDYIGVVSDNL